jgi:hypothetical protein
MGVVGEKVKKLMHCQTHRFGLSWGRCMLRICDCLPYEVYRPLSTVPTILAR